MEATFVRYLETAPIVDELRHPMGLLGIGDRAVSARPAERLLEIL